DRFGSKRELFILPVTALFTTILMQTLEMFPEIYNYPKRFSEENAKDFYLNSRKMINQVKNVILILFSMILFESILLVLGWDSRLIKFFMPMAIIGIRVPIIYALIKLRHIKSYRKSKEPLDHTVGKSINGSLFNVTALVHHEVE